VHRRIIGTNTLGALLGVAVLPLVLLVVYGAIGPFPHQSLGQFVGNLPKMYLLMGICDLPQGALLGFLLARITRVWQKRPVGQILIAGTILGSLFGAAAAHFDLERLLLVGPSTETLRIVLTFGLTSVVIMPLLVRDQLVHASKGLQ